MKNLEIRKAEILKIMEQEVSNNFLNGDLWNDCADILDNIRIYGQENTPTPIICKDGYQIGYTLNNGTEIYWTGMSLSGVENY